MTVIVETGAGVRLANAYADAAFVTTYLTDLGRQAGWAAETSAVQDAAVVKATQYIDWRWSGRFGRKFKGTREFTFAEVAAEGSVTFTGLPLTTETLTLGDQTYTFVSALSDPAVVNEVLIGGDAATTASNLADAISAESSAEGVTYSTGTEKSRHAKATVLAAVVTLEACADGASGDLTVLSSAATNVTLSAFSGGLDGGSQPLEFPKIGLFDSAGVRVRGVPRKLKESMALYADRARSAVLAPDPTADPQAGSLAAILEKVGPITEQRTYVGGTFNQTVQPYPEADALLEDYLTSGGGVFR